MGGGQAEAVDGPVRSLDGGPGDITPRAGRSPGRPLSHDRQGGVPRDAGQALFAALPHLVTSHLVTSHLVTPYLATLYLVTFTDLYSVPCGARHTNQFTGDPSAGRIAKSPRLTSYPSDSSGTSVVEPSFQVQVTR